MPSVGIFAKKDAARDKGSATGGIVLTTARAILRELAAAFAVIAVFALTFIYQPVLPVAATEIGARFSDLSYCGGAPAGDAAGEHGPCHACRSKAVALPPPPCIAVPAFARFYGFSFVAPVASESVFVVFSAYNSRAPPLSA